MCAKKINKEKKRELPFKKINYLIFLVGFICIAVGFLFLAKGDITISPILLVLGYCVLIPVAILYKQKPKSDQTVSENQQK